jgi:hypothetical protein
MSPPELAKLFIKIRKEAYEKTAHAIRVAVLAPYLSGEKTAAHTSIDAAILLHLKVR